MPETYHKLVSLLNGKFPLIQLADKLHQSPLKLMLWLKPYRKKGVVDLVEIPDLDISSYLTKINKSNVEVDKNTNQQLIGLHR